MTTRTYGRHKKTQQHNTPRVGDAVFIDGKWVLNIDAMGTITEEWVKAQWSRPNGRVCRVDYDVEEATVRFTDHPYADPDEPRCVDISFSSFYGNWDATRECFVLTDRDVS